MTKQEAIDKAVWQLESTGITQYVTRRGNKYDVLPADRPSSRGWKIAEMISSGNVHAYRSRRY
jgi:hypothetical protein